MPLFKPATPGFLTTLAATILLAVVSFSVPWFKTIYFLKASLNVDNQSGYITIGTLGYCLTVGGTETCSKPAIGYQFDPNALLGNNTRFQIPEVFVKWITYALFLHVIALGLSAVSAVFGLLAHVREMSMTCFSSCISGAAAAVALVAFIFDLVLFFLTRTRVRAIDGATAEIGNGLWMTLAAWVLLFFSGCMFGIGRCCIGKRPRAPRAPKNEAGYGEFPYNGGVVGNQNSGNVNNAALAHAEAMRLDAIKAETERKARQAKEGSSHEVGLPTFPEYDATRPLKDDDEDSLSGHSAYRDHPSTSDLRGNAGYHPTPSRQPSSTSMAVNAAGVGTRRQPTAENIYPGGYAPAPRGTRAVDDYYRPSQPAAASRYPPSQPSQQTSYPPSQPSSRILAGPGVQPASPPQRWAEGDLYSQFGGQPANSNVNNTHLHPSQSPYNRQDSYSSHTQASSYHSARSNQAALPSQYDNVSQGQDYTADYAYGGMAPTPPPLPNPYQQQQQQYNAGGYNNNYTTEQSNYNSLAYAAGLGGPSPPRSSTTTPHRQASQSSTYGMHTQLDNDYPPVPTHQQPAHIDTSMNPGGFIQRGQSQTGYVASPTRNPLSPRSPAGGRLPGWREESEGSGRGAAQRAPSSVADMPMPGSFAEPPPQYEVMNPNGAAGYVNENTAYRPAS